MSDEPTDEVPSRPLRELLELDRSLTPLDRRLLECLLLSPGPSTARELSQTAPANLHGLYGALERLEGRGLVTREPRGSSTAFRVAHPNVVLGELTAPWDRARRLAAVLEGPLRDLYESRASGNTSLFPSEAGFTDSPTAASSWLLDGVAGVTSEIWFVGSEAPWFERSQALEPELGKRHSPRNPIRVRMLVPPVNGDDERASQHARLSKAGAEIRYSTRFSSSSVLLDRTALFLRTGGATKPSRSGAAYFRLTAPDLCADLATSAEEEWARVGGPRSAAGRNERPPSVPVSASRT